MKKSKFLKPVENMVEKWHETCHVIMFLVNFSIVCPTQEIKPPIFHSDMHFKAKMHFF